MRPPSYNSISLYGLNTFDAEGISAFFYGLAKGLTYDGIKNGYDTSVETSLSTNCFYSVYGMVDTFDLFIHDLNHILGQKGSFNWFNIAAYDPIHILGDLNVTYQ